MELTKEQIEFLDVVAFRGKWTLNSEGEVDVDGNVIMIDMNLTEIPVKFGKITGHFNCSNNHLTSLEFAPSKVGGDFYCYQNHLTSLEGCPDYVGGNFYCLNNNLLKDYFKNIKEEDFKHWGLFIWGWVIKEYPFLIKIAKNYVSKEDFIELIEHFPKTKLYLR
jgi:hypothetical protein